MDFNKQAIALVLDIGYAEAGRQLGFSHGNIHGWKTRLELNGEFSMELKLEWTENSDDLKLLQQSLMEHVEKTYGSPQRKNFAWVIREIGTATGNTTGAANTVRAGVSGFVHWNWAYISQLWVRGDQRGLGLGTKLLFEVETWCRREFLSGIYIDTFEAGVKAFYESQGFVCIGEIPDFPAGHQRFYLYRKL